MSKKIKIIGVIVLIIVMNILLINSVVAAYLFSESSRPTAPNLQVKIPFLSFSSIGDTGTIRFGNTVYDKWEIYWIRDYISGVYKFALVAAGILVVTMIMVGGILYTTAAGNQNRIAQGMEYISSAIAGLVILIFAYMILWVVNSDIVKTQGIITYGLKSPLSEALTRQLDMTVYLSPEIDCNSDNYSAVCDTDPIGDSFLLNCIRYKNRKFYNDKMYYSAIPECYKKSGTEKGTCVEKIIEDMSEYKVSSTKECRSIIDDKKTQECKQLLNEACGIITSITIIDPRTNRKAF